MPRHPRAYLSDILEPCDAIDNVVESLDPSEAL